jgi:NAD-dependent SIR2 family protein deacetylase
MTNTKALIISSVEKVTKISDENVNDKYCFNGKEIEANEDNKAKITKAINKIVNRYISQYENTLVLTGAGCSILSKTDFTTYDISEEDVNKHSGKSMWTLRNDIQSELVAKEYLDLNCIAKLVKYPKQLSKDDDYNLEDLLTKVDVAREFLDDDIVHKFNKSINYIEEVIRDNCTLKLCHAHPHKLFLDKLTSRKNSFNRVKIYTTNYDTLFEDAAEDGGCILVDGFSFSKQKKFSSKYFDYDFVERQGSKIPDEPKYISKVIHLLKIHGSIDWVLGKDNNVYKKQNLTADDPLIIYPRRAKFEQSYEKPFFDLFSRFQNDLKQPNTLLMVIGFSFADKHICSIVEEAIKHNSGLKLLIIDINIEKDDYKFFIDRANKFEDVMLFSSSFKCFVENVYKKQNAYSDELFEGGDSE